MVACEVIERWISTTGRAAAPRGGSLPDPPLGGTGQERAEEEERDLLVPVVQDDRVTAANAVFHHFAAP